MDQPFLSGSPQPQKRDDHSFEFNPAEYWALAKRHWLTIVAAGLLGLAWGFVQFLNSPETYRASTRVDIERRIPSPLGGQRMWLQSVWNPEFYPTQYEILKGQGLAVKVVDLLKLWEDPDFEHLAARSSSSSEVGNTAEDDKRMKVRLAASIRGGLDIRPIRGTSLVDITYRASSGRVAARLANGYAQAFINQGKNLEADATSALVTSINNEIAELVEAIRLDEEQLYTLLDRTDLVSSTTQAGEKGTPIAAANSLWSQAQQKRFRAQADYNSLRNKSDAAIAELRTPSEFSRAQGALFDLEADYNSKRAQYLDTAPPVVDLRQKLDLERQRYQSTLRNLASRSVAEARSTYEKAQREERSLEQQYTTLRGEARSSLADVNSAENLGDSIEAQRIILNKLRATQQEVNVGSGGGRSAIRQLAEAYAPGSPISPILRNKLTGGLGLGLFLGAALVLLIEVLDRTIKTPGELERRLGLPILAAIPDITSRKGYGRYGYGYGYGYGRKRSKGSRRKPKGDAKDEPSIDLIPFRRPRIAVSEAYRGLRTSLLLSSAEELKVIAVTSSFASEGKTATATNLATVLAQLGKKTLLIDGDLRKARIHEVLKVSNRSGLVNYLVGAQPIEKVVLPTEIDNLFVAPAGPAPPNPSELLASTRMEHFLQETKRAFDFVLIDTPPVLAVTDATILGSLTDGMVITCRAGRVTRDELRSCKNRLDLGGVRVLGAVLNCYRPHAGREGRGYSTYHYENYGHSHDLSHEPGAGSSANTRGEVA